MVSYDVPAKRTSLYKKLLKEFLVHEQASVFMGDLPESQVIKLVAKISERIGPEDRVLKLVCRNLVGKDALGGPKEKDGGMAKIGPSSDGLHVRLGAKPSLEGCPAHFLVRIKDALGGPMRQEKDGWLSLGFCQVQRESGRLGR